MQIFNPILFRGDGLPTLLPRCARRMHRGHISFLVDNHTHAAHRNDRHHTRVHMRGRHTALGHLREHGHSFQSNLLVLTVISDWDHHREWPARGARAHSLTAHCHKPPATHIRRGCRWIELLRGKIASQTARRERWICTSCVLQTPLNSLLVGPASRYTLFHERIVPMQAGDTSLSSR